MLSAMQRQSTLGSLADRVGEPCASGRVAAAMELSTSLDMSCADTLSMVDEALESPSEILRWERAVAALTGCALRRIQNPYSRFKEDLQDARPVPCSVSSRSLRVYPEDDGLFKCGSTALRSSQRKISRTPSRLGMGAKKIDASSARTISVDGGSSRSLDCAGDSARSIVMPEVLEDVSTV